ncbi:MAG: hypothetical protein ACLQJ0_22190 [Steroidobacteraceae bacterium]|jgi:hypothetical protein
MAILHIHGRLVVESAGPMWHLSGIVKRDRKMPNRLVLTRTADLLSPNIKAAIGQLLPAVQFTDPAGRSGKIINARIIGASPFRHGNGGPRHSAASTSNEDEEVLLTFDKIDSANIYGNTSSSDDWT